MVEEGIKDLLMISFGPKIWPVKKNRKKFVRF